MIYCVEDEKNIRELLIYTLETTGFSARGMANSKELKDALKEELPDLILLDIMLPGEDGYSILERLKASSETQNIPCNDERFNGAINQHYRCRLSGPCR